jgi:DNA-directed RNA polymerase subunit RPC12/RpoP
MIRFSCKKCGQKLSVEDNHFGKRVKCPKCGSVGVVPGNSDKIKFRCDSCGQSISVPQIHAGKKGKCPKCKNPVVVPSVRKEPAEDAETFSIVCSMCEETIQVPVTSRGQTVKCPACGSSIETTYRGGPAESAMPRSSVPSETDEDQYEDESDVSEESAGVDRRLIFVISGVVAIVVVGLIILVTVILPSKSKRVEEPAVPTRQEVANIDSRSIPVGSNTQSKENSEMQPPKEDVVPKESAQSAVAVRDDVGNLDLKLRLKSGQKHRLRLYREYNSSYTVRGQQHDNGDIHTTELEFEVEQVDANSVTSLKVTYLRINAISKTVQGQSEYDSGKPDTVGDNVFGPIFSALIGRSFIVKVTPEGKIVKIEGLAEMYQQMAEPLVEYEDEATRQKYAGMETRDSEENAKQQIDRANQKYGSREKRIEATREELDKGPYSREENIRDMLDNVIMSFPDRPVGVGDSWMAPFFMGDMELGDCTYTLREINQTVVLVDTSLKIEVDDKVPARADGSRGSSRTTLAGSGQGSLEIDLSNGWMLRKNVTLCYSGETKTAPTERNPRGTTMAQSLENITTVEPIE